MRQGRGKAKEGGGGWGSLKDKQENICVLLADAAGALRLPLPVSSD